MCGFAGLVDPAGGEIDRPLLEAMSGALAHRGPDGGGLWCAPGVGLGHRRLRVIDLSPAADQPMGSADGAVQVVFGGEIYNFADLRAELIGLGHRFRTRSDTEVLVHGYERWGDALLDRIDGMFAFALWDGRRRRLLAARDRMGKKPFYFAQVPRAGGAPPLFAFASELRALLLVPGLDRRVSPQALGRYLCFEYVPPPLAIVRGARKLDAAERLVLDVASDPCAPPAVARYWDLPFPAEPARWGLDEAAEELRTLLGRAVERRLVADVPLAAFLSGGLDSSTVVATMAELAGADRVRTFSIGFTDPRFDESGHARAVAAHLGTAHREERLAGRALLDDLPAVAGILDEPLGDASLIPTHLLCRFARQEVTVALSGDGGDELFAGYPTFLADPVGEVYYRAPVALRAAIARAAGALPASSGYFGVDFQIRQFLRGGETDGPRRHQRWLASFLPEELGTLLRPEVREAAGDPLAEVEGRLGPGRSADRLLAFYARFYLAGDVLTKVDRASMAVGLEVRSPLLDSDVVAFACQLPAPLRRRGLVGKRVLRRAMRGRLPRGVLVRRKQGFAVPVARWLREELAEPLRDELAPEKIEREGLFEAGAVSRLVEEHMSGRRDHRKPLWTLFVLERWLGRWM